MEAGAKGKTYKIGQAAKLLDVKPFVLRFWETEFKDVLIPVRTPAGQRAYSESNVATVREIKRLLYDEGLTIEGAKKRLGQGTAKSPARAAAPRDVNAGAATPEPQAPKGVTLAEIARELEAIRDLLT
jgi:DNA-binding transcriptional MerR regulator